jgi:hypothetical protein
MSVPFIQVGKHINMLNWGVIPRKFYNIFLWYYYEVSVYSLKSVNTQTANYFIMPMSASAHFVLIGSSYHGS